MKAIYQHPQEEAQLAFLLKNDLFRTLTTTYEQLYASVTGFSEVRNRNFRVTKQSHPRLNELFQYAIRRLRCKGSVAFFLEFDNAYSCRLLGSDGDAALLLSSKCLEDMDDSELLALIGRQLAHIQCQHVAYLGINSMIEPLLQRIPLAGAAASEVVKGLLFSWRQYAEMTADRGGALVSGSPNYLAKALMHQMGGCIDRDSARFWAGIRGFRMDQPVEGKITDAILQRIVQELPVPFGMQRLSELMRWCGSDWCRQNLPHLYYNCSCNTGFREGEDAGVLLQRALSCGGREERLLLLHSAARGGNSQAKAYLGRAYLGGSDGVPKDPELGINYIMQGARACDADALYTLGKLYRAGVPGRLAKNTQLSDWLVRAAYGQGQAAAVRELRDKPIRVPCISGALMEKLCKNHAAPPPQVRAALLRWLWIPPQDTIAAWEIAANDERYPKAIAVCDTGIYLRDINTVPHWIDWQSFFQGAFTVKMLSGSVALLFNGKELWRGAQNSASALVHDLIRLAKSKKRKEETSL